MRLAHFSFRPGYSSRDFTKTGRASAKKQRVSEVFMGMIDYGTTYPSTLHTKCRRKPSKGLHLAIFAYSWTEGFVYINT